MHFTRTSLKPAQRSLDLVQQLCGPIALAIENAFLYEESNRHAGELENRVRERTAQLETANHELEAFSYSVSHDLRAPLRSLNGFSSVLIEEYDDQLDERGKNYLKRIRVASQRMSDLIEDLLKLARFSRAALRPERVNLSALVKTVADDLCNSQPGRSAEFVIQPDMQANADLNLLRVVMVNLLGNSWKFTSKHSSARIEVGTIDSSGKTIYYVRDDGAGFDMQYAEKLFAPFQRFHSPGEFEGSGVGLATVQRIIRLHGGRVWAEGEVEKGTTIYFTL
jgi:light-regulated signal transduction histidine kinase (bacteriophytochrome)